MTNKKNKVNELVSDDNGPTAELAVLSIGKDDSDIGQSRSAEADHSTSDPGTRDQDDDVSANITVVQSNLEVRSETVNRLQLDIKQLRARWLGLETEIKAREELASSIHGKFKKNERNLESKEKLLQQRDRTITLLKAEIRERDSNFRELQASAEEIRTANQEFESGENFSKTVKQLSETTGQLASNDAVLRELQAQHERTEEYADELRRQLSDLSSDSRQAVDERNTLEISLQCSEKKVKKLTTLLEAANETIAKTTKALENAEGAREEEIRLLRSELGETEQTLEHNVQIGEQLASDLIDTRTFRDELERMLGENEEESATCIKDLRHKVSLLEKTICADEEKLQSKSEAINSLLTELAKKSNVSDSIEEMEETIQDIDDRMSERIVERRAPGRERVTRLLIGHIDDQELRFPLFKNRLTIGRTQDNDIQLKADYVSRRHAVITNEEDAARVIDWGSRNGVYVNSKRVSERYLKHGDMISIGIAQFRFEELSKRDA